MYKTDTGERRKVLKKEAIELERDAKTATKAAKTVPYARQKAAHEGRGARN